MSIRDLLKSAYRSLPAPPSTNYQWRTIDVNPYDLIPRNATIFDIGSKSARGSYAFGSPPADAMLVCVDIYPGEGVDLVADVHDLSMVQDESVDCVVAVDLLQHIHRPHKAVSELFRILKPEGVLYITSPFIYPFHSDPYDFNRFSCDGLAVLCERFEKVDSGFNRGPASTFCHLSVHFFALLFSMNSSALHTANLYVFRWLLFWIKYLDVFLAKYKMAKTLHNGAYFIGRKPNLRPEEDNPLQGSSSSTESGVGVRRMHTTA